RPAGDAQGHLAGRDPPRVRGVRPRAGVERGGVRRVRRSVCAGPATGPGAPGRDGGLPLARARTGRADVRVASRLRTLRPPVPRSGGGEMFGGPPLAAVQRWRSEARTDPLALSGTWRGERARLAWSERHPAFVAEGPNG